MTDQPVDAGTATSADDPANVLPSEPLTSVQSQIGLLLAALAALAAFIFHKDFSSIVPALTTVAFAAYGGSIAIARAWKHDTNVKATLALHSMSKDIPEREHVQAAFSSVSTDMRDLDARLSKLEDGQKPAKKAAERPVGQRTAARKTTRTRKLSQTL